MKQFFTLLFLVTSLASYAQKETSYYRVLSGKAGELKATLHMHVSGIKITNYLWLENYAIPIHCFTEYKRSCDSLTITENMHSVSITLSGVYKGTGYTGICSLQIDSNNADKTVFTLKEVNDSLFIPFSYFTQEATLAMPGNLQNESSGNFFYGCIWPLKSNNRKLDAALQSTINKLFGNKGAVTDAITLVNTSKTKFSNKWNHAMALIKPDDAKLLGLSLSAEEEYTIAVMYEDERVISLAGFNYVFTGGAHGNYITSIKNINKKTGKVLQLTDVLTTQGINALPKILEAIVRTQYNLDKDKTLEENGLFVKTIKPSNNFYITNGNLGFIYSPYSLMPYAYGEPNLFITAPVINKYLKSAYKKR